MKKLLAVIISIMMVATMIPSMAFAGEEAAKIGENYYNTVTEAITAANDGDTIELLRDVEEDFTLDKAVVLKSAGDPKTVKGKFVIKKGTLENLTLEQKEATFLKIGSSEAIEINLNKVKVLYSVESSNRSDGSANILNGNNARIVIDNCLFTNNAKNEGVNQAKEWSYGLVYNGQGPDGNVVFKNSEFNGAFRTMLVNINGNVTVENNTFINTVADVLGGPTSGSGAESTCITTADTNLNFNITGNTFDNAGAYYFQKTTGNISGNTFKFDKIDGHYIQAGDTADKALDLRDNTFVLGDNDLVVVEKIPGPVIVPAGLKAITYWPWAATNAAIRPADYSSYVFAYNEDGSRTYYPGTAAALKAFVNPYTNHIGVENGETINITSNMEIDSQTVLKITADKNFNINIPKGVTLTISEEALKVAGTLNITGEGNLVILKDAAINVEKDGKLNISTNVDNQGGSIEGEGDVNISKPPTPPTPSVPSGPSAPEVVPPTVDSEGNIEATVKPDASGKVETTVPSETITESLDKVTQSPSEDKPVVEIVVKEEAGSKPADSVDVKVPAEAVDKVAKTEDASLKVTTSVGTVELDNDALNKVASEANGEVVTITVEKQDVKEITSEAQKETIESFGKEDYVFEISVRAGGRTIRQLEGEMTFEFDYELKEGELPENVRVYCVDEDGNKQRVEAKYDEKTKKLVMKTDYLSIFAVSYVDAPSKVRVLKATNEKGKAALRWSRATNGAEGYRIYRAKTKDGKYSPIAWVKDGKAKTFKEKAKKTNKTYYYKVRAYKNVDGKKVWGEYSPVKKLKF